MFLVVLSHTILVLEQDVSHLSRLDDLFRPVRMPLFFTISGMLAARSITRPLSQTRGKTLGLFYLSVLWSLLLFVPFVLPIPGTQDGTQLSDVGWALMPAAYWYLWALAAYFLVARAISSWSMWFTLPILLLLSQASVHIDHAIVEHGSANLDALRAGSVVANFVWFYLGVHGTRLWKRGMDRASRKWGLIACTAYVLAFVIAMHYGTVEESKLALTPFALIAANQLLAFWSNELAIASNDQNLWMALGG